MNPLRVAGLLILAQALVLLIGIILTQAVSAEIVCEPAQTISWCHGDRLEIREKCEDLTSLPNARACISRTGNNKTMYSAWTWKIPVYPRRRGVRQDVESLGHECLHAFFWNWHE